MNIYVIMQNDTPRVVVRCEDNDAAMVVERYCERRTTTEEGKRTEHWWARKFELKEPEDL